MHEKVVVLKAKTEKGREKNPSDNPAQQISF